MEDLILFFYFIFKHFLNLIFFVDEKYNRVNDVDLFERLTKLAVKTGYRDEPSMFNIPRPNEKTLGIDQIILKKTEYEKKYFNK